MSDGKAAFRVKENTISYPIHMLPSQHHDQRPQLICRDRDHRLLKCTWDNNKQKQKRDEQEDSGRAGQLGKGWMEDKRLHFYESVSVCDWSNWLLVLQCSESSLWPVSVKPHSGDWCTPRQQRHYILKLEYMLLKRALHTSHAVHFIHVLSIFRHS